MASEIDELLRAVESQLGSVLNTNVKVVSKRPLGGGCIHDACQISLSNGTDLFLKSNKADSVAVFETEANGLRHLVETKSIKVPEVLAVGTSGRHAFLVLEMISVGSKPPRFSELMGLRIAELHLASPRHFDVKEFGFHEDNFIGATPQRNSWENDWPEFWATCRLDPQLRLASQNGFGGQLQHLGARLLERLPQLLKTRETCPVILHGDLWSGNYLFDDCQRPVLVDPATYFGHAEAEFGMTTLFGGFDDSFYAAYNEVSPLEAGWEDRVAIYRLYHLLNHLNLFGSSYLSGCLEILDTYA